MRKANQPQQQQQQQTSQPTQTQVSQQQANMSTTNMQQQTGGQQSTNQPQSLLQLMMVNSDSGLSMSSVLPSASSSSSLLASSSTNYLNQQQTQSTHMHMPSPQSTHLVPLHPIHIYPSSSTSSISTLAVAGEPHWSSQHQPTLSQTQQTSQTKATDRNIYVELPSSASSISSTSSLLHSGNVSASLVADYDEYGVIGHLTANTNVGNNQTSCNIYEIPSIMLSHAMVSTSGGTSSVPVTIAGSSTLYRSGSKSSTSYATPPVLEPRSEYESLYKRYAELDSFHHEVVKKLSLSQAENLKLRKMHDDIMQQLNQTLREKTSLQQQCTAAIRQWDKAIREIHELQDQLAKVKQQRDEANRECNNAMEGRSKAISERKRMYEERNTALHEYNLIMSERDSVHKEIEKLQEDLHELIKRNEILEKEQKVTLEERESLRRELASALLDRDQAMKACNDLRDKYGKLNSANSSFNSSSLSHHHHHHHHHSSNHHHHTQNSLNLYSQLPHTQQNSQHSLQHGSTSFGVDYGLLSQTNETQPNGHNCSSSSNSSLLGVQSPTAQATNSGVVGNWHTKTRSGTNQQQQQQHISTASSTSSVSTFSMPYINPQQSINTKGELVSPVDSSAQLSEHSIIANSELETMRKQIERLQLELQDVNQEVEVCKKRRDWAFSERDKIVLERESIRTLCDKLRRERDRKVSDLAEALLESDEIKRQKNDALKELKELKEKFDSTSKQSSLQKDTDSSGGGGGDTRNTSTSACVSQDSAIDVDDNGYGRVDCDMMDLFLKRDSKDTDWGFKLSFDTFTDSKDSNPMVIVVASVSHNSIAHQSGRLRVYDQLLKVNDWQLSDGDGSAIQLTKVQSMISEQLQLNLQVRRRRQSRSIQTVSVPLLTSAETATNNRFQDNCLQKICGFNVDILLFVKRIDDAVLRDNIMNIGDRIISIDGRSFETLLRAKFVEVLLKSFDASSNTVNLQILKVPSNSPMPSIMLANHSSSNDNKAIANIKFDSNRNLNSTDNVKGDSDTVNISVIPSNCDQLNDYCDTLNSAVNSDQFGENLSQNNGVGASGGTLVESEVEEEEDRVVVDEDNDADEDEPNSDAEVRTIAELDQVLDKYQIEDFYSSTVTNSSGGSLVAQLSPLSIVAPVSLAPKSATANTNGDQIGKNAQTTTTLPSLKDSIVRRSSRLSKKNRQRCTLAASQSGDAVTSSTSTARRSPRAHEDPVTYDPCHTIGKSPPIVTVNSATAVAAPSSTVSTYNSSGFDLRRELIYSQRHHHHHLLPTHHTTTQAPATSSSSCESAPIQAAQLPLQTHYAPNSHSHSYSHHLETENSKIAPLGHNYNSIKSNGVNSYSFDGPESSSSNTNFYYTAQPTQQPNSYSSIYSTYSSFRSQHSSGNDGSKSANNHHTSTPVQQDTPASQREIFVYGNHSNPLGSTLMDYSVVSAQMQDKNVLKYYKTRQASGSSQTGSTGGVTGSSSGLSPMFVPYSTGSGLNVISSSSIVPHHQSPTHTNTYPGSNSSTTTNRATSDIYSLSFANDIYGQARSKLNADLYNNISTANARNSMPVTFNFANYSLPNSLFTTAGGYPNHHLVINSNQQQSQYATLISTGNNRANNSPLNNAHHRLSMNLENISLNITSSLMPNRDSLLMTNGQHGTNWNNEHTSYASSVKKIPEVNSLVSLSSTHSYKNSFNTTSNYESIYDTLDQPSRASSLTSPATSQHQYSLLGNIYGSVKRATTAIPIQQASASSNRQSYFSNDESQLSSSVSFDDTYAHPLNQLMPSRSQRLRIPSNSSTVSTSKVSTKSTISGLLPDKPLIGAPTYNTAGVLGSSSGGAGGVGGTSSASGSGSCSGVVAATAITNIIGDRNSCSLFSAGGPPFEIKWIKCAKDGSPGSPILDCRKAKPDDYRLISVERSSALLGIRILRTTKSKGVFVQMVTEGSLAAQAGIKVGDQIIDICGLNMRAADYENAAKVLNQCGDPLQMLVQYNYEKYKEILMMYGDGQGSDSLCQ